MLKFIKTLFSGRDPLIEVAKSGDFELFASSFFETEFVVLSAHSDLAIPASGASADELVDSIEAAAEQAASDEDIQLFMLEVDGQPILPLFTTHESAETFVQALARQAGQVIPFSAISMAAEDIVQAFEPGMDIVLNAGSPSEFLLAKEHLDSICRVGQ